MITISEEEKEQAWLMSREKHILDYKNNPAYAEQVGHVKGRAEGLAEGMAEATLRIAKNALAEGATVEFVQKITGLDMKIIKNIHKVRVKHANEK
jgi:predicted transposase/invertase (TIGR01784 family)